MSNLNLDFQLWQSQAQSRAYASFLPFSSGNTDKASASRICAILIRLHSESCMKDLGRIPESTKRRTVGTDLIGVKAGPLEGLTQRPHQGPCWNRAAADHTPGDPVC
jgi:hypothetical protein